GEFWVNGSFQKKFGDISDYPSFQDWWLASVHPDDLELVRKNYAECLQSSTRDWGAYYRLKTNNENYIWVVETVVIEREGSVAKRIIGQLFDFSRQKEVENALNLARRKAEEANQLKSVFLA